MKKPTKPKGRKHNTTKLFIIKLLLENPAGLDSRTLRERVEEEMNMRSPKAAYPHLRTLKDKGLIKYDLGRSLYYIPKKDMAEYYIKVVSEFKIENRILADPFRYMYAKLDSKPCSDLYYLRDIEGLLSEKDAEVIEHHYIHRYVSHSAQEQREKFLASTPSAKKNKVEADILSQYALHLSRYIHAMDSYFLDSSLKKLEHLSSLAEVKKEIRSVEKERLNEKRRYLSMMSKLHDDIRKKLPGISDRSYSKKYLKEMDQWLFTCVVLEAQRLEVYDWLRGLDLNNIMAYDSKFYDLAINYVLGNPRNKKHNQLPQGYLRDIPPYHRIM